MTELYLIRHAHAVDAAEDPERPLSERGRKQVRALVKFLRRSGALQPGEIWHSSLARSRETALLLARGLDLGAALVSVAGLEPEDEPAAIALRLKAVRHPLAIVGHEPHLSALASLLVAGPDGRAMFVLKKCAVLALEGAGARWQVRWLVFPELLA
ncbi:MAG: histidine phosphatase family protein [Verrucomicrobia bacterium]|nr:histidine phosphatase family protein [Verrucomicrobiota bacterium]